MPRVNSRNMPFEKALRIFRRQCQNAGIVQEVRERQYYEKPASKRQRKKAAAVKRQQKITSENNKHLRRQPRHL